MDMKPSKVLVSIFLEVGGTLDQTLPTDTKTPEALSPFPVRPEQRFGTDWNPNSGLTFHKDLPAGSVL